jgi:hypothetical protein
MTTNIRGWILSLALVGIAACGGSTGTDLGLDPGTDTPAPIDVPGDPITLDDGVSDPDTNVERDVAPESINPDDTPIIDVVPDAEPDVPPADEGVTGDLPSEVEPTDVPPEPGDTCEGPQCVPCPDDGLACTDGVHADDGVCVVVVQPGFCLIGGVCFGKFAVDPANPCRTCQPEIDVEAYAAAIGEPCLDTTPCTLGGVCTADATCVPAVKPCDDGTVCTVDRCINNVCDHQPFTSTCSDGSLCTQFDQCVNGVCVGTPKTCVNDFNSCTDEACNPATGNCVTTFNTNACDDFSWCTLDDACAGGTCTGRDRDCGDTDPCTRDSCVATGVNTGECRHLATPGQPCEDGNLCTANDMCDAGNICRSGGTRTCNDNNVCTDDSCNPATGCVFAAHTRSCDDGDNCTESDVCGPTGCHGTRKACDDGNPCTADACVNSSCQHLAQPNNLPCDDGNVCTTGDRCQNSYCVATGTQSCDDLDACTLDGCVMGVGCTHSAASCNDNNPCTDDTCNPATGCVHTPNTFSCDDLNPCTVSDTCTAGTCKGAQRDCKDTDPCTNDSCVAGNCVHTANLGACDDGNACTEGEMCFAGVCKNGTAVTCNDLQSCTADSCNPAVGCVFTPVGGGCDDHTVCTTGDTCSNGRCVGAALNCDDDNYCTDDLCHPVTGCYHEGNDLLCNDANGCTILDQCRGGTCAGVNIFANPLSKGATLQFSTLGTPATGLDVDGSAATCAPSPDCSDGVDNYFGRMGIFITDQFAVDMNKVVADGRLALLMEHESPGPGAGPYGLNVLYGQRTDPVSCNPATPGCNYLAFQADLIDQCSPRYLLSNATIVGNTLTAGGKEFQAVIYFAFCSTANNCVMLPQVLKWAQIRATVSLDLAGHVVGGSGILAGAIDVKAFKLSLEPIPEVQFSPYTKDQIIQQVDSRLCGGTSTCGDIDTDSKLGNDAASIGLPFTIVTGNGVGRI